MTSIVLATALALGMSSADDKLPDVSLIASDLATAYVSTNNPELPAGTRGLRFATASVNYGVGRLEVRGSTVIGNTQLVNQRIYRTDGSTWDRPAGSFTYHPEHGHIHFDDWTVFRLRRVLPGNGVGEVIAQGAKTSFCILEIRRVNSNAPGHNESPGYSSCGQIQGLRPGWADIYGAGLYGQVIDLTGVADGTYWLEGDIDPNDQILESDETNNAVRVQVVIGTPPPAVPDVFEENDSLAQVNAAPVAAPNSPNIGLVLEELNIDPLSMEDANDYFKVKLHAGEPGSFVQLTSPFLQGNDIDMQILSSTGTVLRSSTGSSSWEYISLDGLAAGDYFIRVYKYSSGDNPRYSLQIVPSENNAPILVMDEPATGMKFVEKSFETFPVVWNGHDPDNDPKFVSLLRSRKFNNHATAEAITGYQDMPNAQGSVNMNTADFALGQWHILGVGSDGGAQTHSWAPGSVYVYLKGDINQDGHVHVDDYLLANKYFNFYPQLMLSGYNRFAADMDRNGKVNEQDLEILKRLAYDHDHGH